MSSTSCKMDWLLLHVLGCRKKNRSFDCPSYRKFARLNVEIFDPLIFPGSSMFWRSVFTFLSGCFLTTFLISDIFKNTFLFCSELPTFANFSTIISSSVLIFNFSTFARILILLTKPHPYRISWERHCSQIQISEALDNLAVKSSSCSLR